MKWEDLVNALVPHLELVPHMGGSALMGSSGGSGAIPYSSLKFTVNSIYGGNTTQFTIYELRAYESVADAVSGNDYLRYRASESDTSHSGTSTPISRALDVNLATAWMNVNGSGVCSGTINLSSAKVPKVFGIISSVAHPETWKLEGSNDGTNWSMILDATAYGKYFVGGNATEAGLFLVALPGTQLIQLQITSVQGGGIQAQIKEFQVYSDLAGTVPLLTGGAPTCKSHAAGQYASFTFDISTSGYWANDTAGSRDLVTGTGGTWVGYIMPDAAPTLTAANIKLLVLTPSTAATCPSTFKLRSSTDGGATWTTILDSAARHFLADSNSNPLRILYDSFPVTPSNIKFQTHAEGANNSTALEDVMGHAFTRSGTAVVSTTQYKSGSSSLRIPGTSNSGWATSNYPAEFTFGYYYPFTFECWVYVESYGNGGASNYIFSAASSVGVEVYLGISVAGLLTSYINGVANNPTTFAIATNQWQHVFVGMDASGYGWVGGDGWVQKTSTSSARANGACNISIGRQVASGSYGITGYIDECRLTIGEFLYPGNYIVPSAPFTDPSFTYTWNTLDKDVSVTLSNGNLTASALSNCGVRGTVRKAAAAWFFEARCDNAGTAFSIGIGDASASLTTLVGSGIENSYSYRPDGWCYHSGFSGTGVTYTTGDYIGVAFDGTAATLKFYKNGTLVKTYTSVVGAFYPMFAGDGPAQATINLGATAFAYTKPSGYKSWDGTQP